MPRKRLHPLLFLPILVLLVSLACNLPLTQDTATQSDRIKTAAAETLAAQMTEVSKPPATDGATPVPPEASPTPTPTLGTAPSETPTATVTGAAVITNTPKPYCNLIKFVKDVNVPDNSEFSPGKAFTKTWRLQNAGTCAWDATYRLIVDGKNPLNAPTSSSITSGKVDPGTTVDISVPMTAPDTVGTYRNDFKLQSGDGVIFGIGEQSKPFWAQIEVIVATGLTYDFNIKAAQAKWASGTGDNLQDELTFGGDPADPLGTARISDGVKLENNAISGKLLLTIPKRTDNGLIQGIFPAYLVQPGDHLKGRIGFMLPSGSGVCGEGKLRFQIDYKLGETRKKLGEWVETCDGTLTPLNIDLTSLKGNSVQFILVVHSVGQFLDNYAVWNSLGVVHE